MRSVTTRLLIAALFAALSSPAHSAWKEVRSRNFIVYSEGTDASLKEAAERLEKFDFLLRAVSNSANKSSPVPLKVYLMSSRTALQATMGLARSDGVAGYYTASSRGPIAVGTRFDSDRRSPGFTRAGKGISDGLTSQAVLLHEYAHHFMFQHFPAAYPTWYSEGFAEYYSSTRFLPGDVIEVGHIASQRYASFEWNDWLPLNRLLTAKTYRDVDGEIHMLYAEGWLLVHYLGNAPHRAGQLSRYLHLLNSGVGYERAMDQAFGPGARQLDSELRAYSRGRLNAVRLPFKPIDVGQITIRSLSPAEEALIESDIALGRGVYLRGAGQFAQSVRRIASRFPGDPYALRMLAEAERAAGNRAAAGLAVDAWLSASPNSAHAKLMKAQLMVDELSDSKSKDGKAWAAARSLILQANKLAPTEPMIFEAFYDSFLAQGVAPSPGAQNALFRAFQLVPQDEDIRFKLAADFEARDMIEDAITIIKPLAFATHDPDEEPEGREAQRRRLEEKFRVVGDTVGGNSPREMLARLEAKLAATKN